MGSLPGYKRYLTNLYKTKHNSDNKIHELGESKGISIGSLMTSYMMGGMDGLISELLDELGLGPM